MKNLQTTAVAEELDSLRAAAQAALRKGWYVFGSPYKTKATFKGSHGSRDALNDSRALTRWDNGIPANPCIRLDRSGLTILDVDHGLTSMKHAEAWAEANGLPPTYIVSSGRQPFGCHFYFNGTRTLPDVIRNKSIGRIGFELDGVSGDIKCHGHVVAEGGLHKSGLVYRGNGRAVASLPEWLRDYEDPIAKARRKLREAANEKAGQSSQTGATDNKVSKGRRHGFLLREAGRLRWQGLETDTIYLALKDICARFCEDGDNYSDCDLRGMAQFTGQKPCDRKVARKKFMVRAAPQTQQELVARSLEREFKEGCPVSIETIKKRLKPEHFSVSEGTLRRAMTIAGFLKTAKDPSDGRKQLWMRRARVSGIAPPCPLTAIEQHITAYM